MANNRKNNTRILEAFSPEDLNGTLEALSQSEGMVAGPVILSIRGPRVMGCAFHLTNVSLKDVRSHLMGEAMELLSLTSDDIEFDFQITDSDEENIRGIYICSPRRVVENYLLALEDSRLRPVAVTEYFLTCVNSLYRQDKIGKGRVAFLFFSTGRTIDLFVANDGKQELIRKISFETFEEARGDIVQSLRSACAKSWPKHYDVIYYAGNVENIDELRATLKKAFNVDLKECSTNQPSQGHSSGTDYFTVNLLKRYIFSQKEKRMIKIGVNLVLALCALYVLTLGLQMTFKKLTIEKFQKSYSVQDYQQALDLKKKLK